MKQTVRRLAAIAVGIYLSSGIAQPVDFSWSTGAEPEYVANAIAKSSVRDDGLATRLKAVFLIQAYDVTSNSNYPGIGLPYRGQPEVIAATRRAYDQFGKSIDAYLAGNENKYDEVGFINFLKSGAGTIISATPQSAVLKILLLEGTEVVAGQARGAATARRTREIERQLFSLTDGGRDAKQVYATLFKRAQSDPALRQLIDQKLGPKLNARIQDSAETIRRNNPDAFKSDEISALVSQVQQRQISDLDAIRSVERRVQASLNSQQTKAETAAAREKQHRVDIAAAEVWISNLVWISATLKVPETTTNNFVTVAKAAVLLKETRHLLTQAKAAGNADAVATLATGNYLQVGFMLAGMFMKNGPSPDAIIQEQLREIRKDIAELRNFVGEHFQALNETISRNHAQVLSRLDQIAINQRVAQDDLDALRMSLKAVEQQITLIYEFKLAERYYDEIAPCFPERASVGNRKVSLTAATLEKCANAMIKGAALEGYYASVLNANSANATRPETFFSLERDPRGLGQYLAEAFGQTHLLPYAEAKFVDPRSIPLSGPTYLVDPDQWRLHAADFLQLVIRNSGKIPSRSAYSTQLYHLGRNLMMFRAALASVPSSDGTDRRMLNTDLANAMIDRYGIVLRELVARLDEIGSRTTLDHFNIRGGAANQIFVEQTLASKKAGQQLSIGGLVYCDDQSLLVKRNDQPPRGVIPPAGRYGEQPDGVVQLERRGGVYRESWIPGSEQDYQDFVGFEKKDEVLLATVPIKKLLALVPSPYKMAATLGPGELQACVKMSYDNLFIGIQKGDRWRVQKVWRFDVKMEMRLRYVVAADIRRDVPARSYLVATVPIEQRNQIWSANFWEARKWSGAEYWKAHILPKLEAAKPTGFVWSSDDEAVAFLSELERRFAVAREGIVARANVEVNEVKQAERLYSALETSLRFSAGSLFESPGLGSLTDVFGGRDGLPSPQRLASLVVGGDIKNVDLIQRELARRVAFAKALVESLSGQPVRTRSSDIEVMLTGLAP